MKKEAILGLLNRVHKKALALEEEGKKKVSRREFIKRTGQTIAAEAADSHKGHVAKALIGAATASKAGAAGAAGGSVAGQARTSRRGFLKGLGAAAATAAVGSSGKKKLPEKKSGTSVGGAARIASGNIDPTIVRRGKSLYKGFARKAKEHGGISELRKDPEKFNHVAKQSLKEFGAKRAVINHVVKNNVRLGPNTILPAGGKLNPWNTNK